MVEAASQQAVRDWGETILKKGFDLMVIATGAYGDPKLYQKHIKAAEKSGARLRLPSGAIAGLDGLLAMRLGKLERVKYARSSRRMPGAARRPRPSSTCRRSRSRR